MTDRLRHLGLWYFTCFLVFYALRYINGLTLFQLGQPEILLPRQDPVLWLWQLSNVPQLMTGGLAIYFDIALAVLALCGLYVVYQNKMNSRFALVFILVLWAYILSIFAFPSLSVRKYLGIAIIPLIFLLQAPRQESFWEVLRYYILFIFSSSALWKVCRGSVFHEGQMESILEGQLAANLIHYPNDGYTQTGMLLLQYPAILNTLFVVATLLQLSFLIGFFTKRFDKLIAVLMVLFIIADYWIMRIEYWEFLIFLPFLWWSLNKVDVFVKPNDSSTNSIKYI